MQPIPECTICGAPTGDRWCAECDEEMAQAADAAAAARGVECPVVQIDHDVAMRVGLTALEPTGERAR